MSADLADRTERALEWAEYQRRNEAARGLADLLAECPYCSEVCERRSLARHKVLCAALCQKCGTGLPEGSEGDGVHAECVSGTATVNGRRVRYISLLSTRRRSA